MPASVYRIGSMSLVLFALTLGLAAGDEGPKGKKKDKGKSDAQLVEVDLNALPPALAKQLRAYLDAGLADKEPGDLPKKEKDKKGKKDAAKKELEKKDFDKKDFDKKDFDKKDKKKEFDKKEFDKKDFDKKEFGKKDFEKEWAKKAFDQRKYAEDSITLIEAIRIAEKSVRGVAIKADRKGEPGDYHYKIDLLFDGAKTKVKLDSAGYILDIDRKGDDAKKSDKKGKGKGN